MTSVAAPAQTQSPSRGHRVEQIGLFALFAMAATIQFSIAIGQSFFAIAAICWVTRLITERETPAAPRFFWPLLAYAGATLVSAAFSANPAIGFADSKQLLLFLIVPITYRLLTGPHVHEKRPPDGHTNQRVANLLTLIMTVGAASAALGIFQYGLLHYDQLSQRPQGTLGHYMTYSGLLMLVVGVALARLLFAKDERLWPALVMPALIMALALTSTRSAWVGICVSAGVLLTLKDFRLLAVLPIVGAITFAAAGPAITHRLMSTFDSKDPTRRDRVAMLHEGELMVRAHPWVGVGPNMVEKLYSQYRVPEAVEQVNPHLHNVPVQIAAERGLPALAIWLTFIGVLAFDLLRLVRRPAARTAAAAAIAALVSMLAAGMFEYNFGDSEFLMLLLVLVTIPFAVQTPEDASHA
ncbi:MAG: O-antigen ligase family protein [Acidobacteriaceae bacterium]|nr:O-antigen ligase family protein [Acidobacteriaceae bacterium]